MSIFLGGTGSDNELHDYEKGTWTPDVNGRTSGTPNTQAGDYVKVGNSVHLTCHFDTGANSLTSSAGVMTVTGLPFAAKGGSSYASTGGIHFNNSYTTAGDKGELHGLVPPNTALINIYYSDSSTMVHLPVSQVGTGNFLFSCTYIASS
tara:strand:- start:32 stop:478 length:447 start_codon:yes stop_codon:yes gene_type:complete